MKIFTKISFVMIAIMAVVSSTSCTVQYKSRHPHHEAHEREGMVKPIISFDSIVVAFTQQIPEEKAFITNDNKTK